MLINNKSLIKTINKLNLTDDESERELIIKLEVYVKYRIKDKEVGE